METVNIATISQLIRDMDNKEPIFSDVKIDEADINITDDSIVVSFPKKDTCYSYQVLDDIFKVRLSGKDIDFDDTEKMHQNFHLFMMFFNCDIPIEVLPDILKTELNNQKQKVIKYSK